LDRLDRSVPDAHAVADELTARVKLALTASFYAGLSCALMHDTGEYSISDLPPFQHVPLDRLPGAAAHQN